MIPFRIFRQFTIFEEHLIRKLLLQCCVVFFLLFSNPPSPHLKIPFEIKFYNFCFASKQRLSQWQCQCMQESNGIFALYLSRYWHTQSYTHTNTHAYTHFIRTLFYGSINHNYHLIYTWQKFVVVVDVVPFITSPSLSHSVYNTKCNYFQQFWNSINRCVTYIEQCCWKLNSKNE